MTVTTDDGGRQNLFAREPQMYITQEDMDKHVLETHNERAEKLNGRVAMISIIIGLVSYISTGKLFFFTW